MKTWCYFQVLVPEMVYFARGRKEDSTAHHSASYQEDSTPILVTSINNKLPSADVQQAEAHFLQQHNSGR